MTDNSGPVVRIAGRQRLRGAFDIMRPGPLTADADSYRQIAGESRQSLGGVMGPDG